ELFDQAFRLFWRDAFGLESAMAQLLPHVRVPREQKTSRRVAEAWRPPVASARPIPEEAEFDAALTFSPDEVFRTRDFEAMSAEELARAKRIAALLPRALRPVRMRR